MYPFVVRSTRAANGTQHVVLGSRDERVGSAWGPWTPLTMGWFLGDGGLTSGRMVALKTRSTHVMSEDVP